MQRAHFRWMSLLLGLVPGLCSAQIYSYVTQSTGSPSNASYKFVLESWDMDDLSPNPCYQQANCAIGINHRHTSTNTGAHLRCHRLPTLSARRVIRKLLNWRRWASSAVFIKASIRCRYRGALRTWGVDHSGVRRVVLQHALRFRGNGKQCAPDAQQRLRHRAAAGRGVRH